MRQLAVISFTFYQKLKKENINLTALITIDNLTIPLALINDSSNVPILLKTERICLNKKIRILIKL